MEIVLADKKDCGLLALIVRRSNKDVAELLGLNKDNAAKHPSFCTPEWIMTDFKRGQKYFICTENGLTKGCVAFEQPDKKTAYLNRLSVLPEFRNRGLGTSLLQHIIDYSKEKKIKNISIGIIAEYTQLKVWYVKKGFIVGDLQKFSHLPFNVLYMKYEI